MSAGQGVQTFTLCCARVRGKNKNTFYPDDRAVNNLAELLEAAQYDHTPGFLQIVTGIKKPGAAPSV